MIESQYLFPIGLGILFLIVGICLILVAKREIASSPAANRPEVKPDSARLVKRIFYGLFGCVAGLMGLFTAAAILLFSPSISERRHLFEGGLHSPVTTITLIEINPRRGMGHKPLTPVPVIVKDRAAIARLAAALNAASDFNPNHPAEKWSAAVTVVTAKAKYTFIVTQTVNSDNGTLIRFWSGDGAGWVIGTFRQDQLGIELEKLVKGP